MDKLSTQGKREDFSRLWVDVYPAVGAYVASLTVDYHSTEEVLARVMVVLFEKIDQYDPARPFEAWAIGIAKYEVLRYRREKARDRLEFSDELLDRIGHRCHELSHEINTHQSALQQCLKEVVGRAAQALTLRYGEGLRYNAIARRLGMKAGAVRVMLHRTQGALRQCVERRLESEGE